MKSSKAQPPLSEKLNRRARFHAAIENKIIKA